MRGRSQHYAILAYAVTSSILAVVRAEGGHASKTSSTSVAASTTPGACSAPATSSLVAPPESSATIQRTARVAPCPKIGANRP